MITKFTHIVADMYVWFHKVWVPQHNWLLRIGVPSNGRFRCSVDSTNLRYCQTEFMGTVPVTFSVDIMITQIPSWGIRDEYLLRQLVPQDFE